MLRASTFIPAAHGPRDPDPAAPSLPGWHLRLRDHVHVRLTVADATVVRPGALAGASVLLVAHHGPIALVLPEAEGTCVLAEGDVALLARAAAWELALPGVGSAATERRTVDVAWPAPGARRPSLARGARPPAGSEVSLVALRFEDETEADLLRWLPPVVRGRAHGPAAPAVASLLAGVEAHDPGCLDDPAMGARALELLLLGLLRRRPPAQIAAPGSLPIRKAVELMRGGLVTPWRVATLAARVGLSRSAFAARFTNEVGQPPLHYLAGLRLGEAATRLLRTDEPIKSIAAGVGYESMPSFCKAFRLRFGLAPGAYRARGARRPA